MGYHQIAAIIILALFYAAYFAKMYVQKQHGIETYQLNRGDKPVETQKVERFMRFATLAIIAAEIISIVFDMRISGVDVLKPIGLVIAFAGVLIFIVAMVTMQDSWRAGINRGERTKLVTNGIYRFSRNPAFVGFDFMYIGVMLSFFNIVLMCFTLLAVVSLHLQILQEEKFLLTAFGADYAEYKNRVRRYIGKR